MSEGGQVAGAQGHTHRLKVPQRLGDQEEVSQRFGCKQPVCWATLEKLVCHGLELAHEVGALDSGDTFCRVPKWQIHTP